ncbi:MAG: hypothetical protein ACWGSD_06550, partial [Thermodesulfobacteriota bacterium]
MTTSSVSSFALRIESSARLRSVMSLKAGRALEKYHQTGRVGWKANTVPGRAREERRLMMKKTLLIVIVALLLVPV